jgi:DNA adenine methylase
MARAAQEERSAPTATAPPLRPILKWAGGKSRLVPQIVEKLPTSIGTYYEPFVGGAAVFFALASQPARFRKAVLSDANRDLVEVYLGVQNHVAQVIKLLRAHQERHDREFYYRTRETDPLELDLAERAARLIYLNKTGYNGLYRVNQSGQFNVPMGRYKNPNICDEERLHAAASALKGVRLKQSDFAQAALEAKPGDAVYFDPPYVPLSKTSSFTAYHKDAFGEDEHKRLAQVLLSLTERGVCVVLSNSNTPFTRKLYKHPQLVTKDVLAARAINSKSSHRGEVAELLVSNQPTPKTTSAKRPRARS